MIFINRLKLFFLIVLVVSSFLLIYIWYKDYKFKNSPLSIELQEKIHIKENQIKSLVKKYYKINVDVPIIISDRLSNKHFGLASFNNGKIVIYLNKNHFLESENYMINDVLPHEYAHALMFIFGDFSNENGGHSKKWQNICKNLNGLRCERFVNTEDIIIGKTNFFNDNY